MPRKKPLLDVIMETEFEVKFYPVDKEEYRRKLIQLGAKCVISERKMRRSIFDGRNHPGQFKCDYIRVRDEGNLISMSGKTHAREGRNVSDQKETEIEVSDFDKAVEIVKLMGFEPDRYQETLRESWDFRGIEITVDTWPNLKPYTEIEAKSEDLVKDTAEKLGFKWENRIVTAAAEIMAKVYNLTIDEVLDKVTNITFENNPFEGLKRND